MFHRDWRYNKPDYRPYEPVGPLHYYCSRCDGNFGDQERYFKHMDEGCDDTRPNYPNKKSETCNKT